jgi:hypothetical protein
MASIIVSGRWSMSARACPLPASLYHFRSVEMNQSDVSFFDRAGGRDQQGAEARGRLCSQHLLDPEHTPWQPFRSAGSTGEGPFTYCPLLRPLRLLTTFSKHGRKQHIAGRFTGRELPADYDSLISI